MSELVLRYMQLRDIPQVVVIDNQSFDPPWSPRSYTYEISEASYSHMLVLTYRDEPPLTGWRRWLGTDYTAHKPPVLGYGGLWNIADEGHISTIATHPEHRGKSYGELLLAAMLHRAITLGAAYVVLEVRVSNVVAQNLYRKYEFDVAGTKPNYYRSDNEDAYDMRLDLNDIAMIARFHERYSALMARTQVLDEYSTQEIRKKHP